MPAGFTGPFAKRLNAICNITVEETIENAVLTRGHVYIAAAGSHVSLNRHSNGQVVIHASTHPADALHIPSVDVMMTSVAAMYHGLAMGIILTGMGADGSIGMRSIFEAGGLTVGQDEETCVVYGMPRCCAQQNIQAYRAPPRNTKPDYGRCSIP
jgi:two-component system chemotaxis response regulator CheB